MVNSPLWSALPVPALQTDAQDRITAITPALETTLNHSAKGMIGRPIWDVLVLDTDVQPVWQRARTHAQGLTIAETEVSAPGGIRFRASLYCAPLDGGMIVQIVPRDPARMMAGSKADKAARSAIGMAEMLAHEIKNPLAGITGAAQLLSMSLPGKDTELTDLIVGECRRITGLLAQVEEFGNLQPSARQATNVHDVLDRARRSAELGFAAHMSFVESYDPSLPEALVNPDQLLQVVLNLIKNAAEANPKGGSIRLHSFYDATMRTAEGPLPLHIDIVDDGPGLPPEIADQVFDPFVSGRENGTGLGLALVSKLMRDNGGLVAVESCPGTTRFRLSLPRSQEK